MYEISGKMLLSLLSFVAIQPVAWSLQVELSRDEIRVANRHAAIFTDNLLRLEKYCVRMQVEYINVTEHNGVRPPSHFEEGVRVCDATRRKTLVQARHAVSETGQEESQSKSCWIAFLTENDCTLMQNAGQWIDGGKPREFIELIDPMAAPIARSSTICQGKLSEAWVFDNLDVSNLKAFRQEGSRVESTYQNQVGFQFLIQYGPEIPFPSKVEIRYQPFDVPDKFRDLPFPFYCERIETKWAKREPYVLPERIEFFQYDHYGQPKSLSSNVVVKLDWLLEDDIDLEKLFDKALSRSHRWEAVELAIENCCNRLAE